MPRTHGLGNMRGLLPSLLARSAIVPNTSAAVLFAMRPSVSVDEMESTLKATGRPIVDARNGVRRSRIDLFAGMKALMAQTRRRAIRQ